MNSVRLITTLVLLLAFRSCGIAKEIRYNQLIENNGLFYENGEKEPYTGKVLSFYENGQKQLEGYFKDGLHQGEFLSWYENGQLCTRGSYHNDKQ